MRLFQLVVVCILLTACTSSVEQPVSPVDVPEIVEAPIVIPVVSEPVPLANTTQNTTVETNATTEPEEASEPLVNESAQPILVNGAVDVTARIGAFKSRQTLQEGEGMQVNNRTLIVVFIGEATDGPQVMFELDDETVTMSRRDDSYLDNAWLYVHEIYYRDRYENT